MKVTNILIVFLITLITVYGTSSSYDDDDESFNRRIERDLHGRRRIIRMRTLHPKVVEWFKKDVIARIDTFTRDDDDGNTVAKSLIASLVRLSFHDCAGITNCDGCIDPDNMDHKGLEYGVIYPIEQVYQNRKVVRFRENAYSYKYNYYTNVGEWKGNPSRIQWSRYFSRNDMWHLASLAALEYGVELNTGETIKDYNTACVNKTGDGIIGPSLEYGVKCVNIKYQIGRPVCKTSPWAIPQYDRFFTSKDWSLHRLYKFFNHQFGFNVQQMVAIMGAHSIGRSHADLGRKEIIPGTGKCCGGSGFRGAWQGSEDNFGNAYFGGLNRLRFMQHKANKPRRLNPADDVFFQNYSDVLQWVGGVGSPTNGLLVAFFLNVDVLLHWRIGTSINSPISKCIVQRTLDALNENRTIFTKYYDGTLSPVCEREVITQKWVDMYREDNIRFLYDFMKTFQIMIYTLPRYAYENDLSVSNKDSFFNDLDTPTKITMGVVSTLVIVLIFAVGYFVYKRYNNKKGNNEKSNEIDMATVIDNGKKESENKETPVGTETTKEEEGINNKDDSPEIKYADDNIKSQVV